MSSTTTKDTRALFVTIRTTIEERAAMLEAARKADLPLSLWARRILKEAARPR